eukprot:TRINITY_DN1300_c0_g1_i2.p1 TRINITY_DN1300_c0_g1~~TRINITY_DN1300_c0_g1_i2.p1  ORF type:complete len:127 (-),score=34.18 TRINITY_DN1300_c0_g1_i2:356-736(-)
MTDNRLFIAAYSALPEKVEALVEAGADPAMVAGDGKTAIHFACGSDKYDDETDRLRVVNFLLSHGVDPNIRTKTSGSTPLWVAANRGNVPLVKLLLEHGADPSIPNNVRDLLSNGENTYQCEISIS